MLELHLLLLPLLLLPWFGPERRGIYLGINTCGENKSAPRTGCLKQNLRRRQSTLFRATIFGSMEPPPPPPLG